VLYVLQAGAFTCLSYVNQPVQYLFFALSTMGHRVYWREIKDAFTRSPKPDVRTYTKIGDTFAEC